MKAAFTVDASIKAPTVIYQSGDYWCDVEAGCSCSYASSEGVALDKASYTETVEGNLTSLTIIDASLNGTSVAVICGPVTAEPTIE